MNHLRLLAVGIICLFTSLAFGQSDQRFKVRVYQDSSLPTAQEDPDFENPLPGPTYDPETEEYDDPVFQVVFSIDLVDGDPLTDDELKAGEILLIMGEVQFRQDNQCNDHNVPTGHPTAGAGCGVYLGSQATYTTADFLGNDDLEFEIATKNLENLSAADDLKKQTTVKVGTFRVLEEHTQLTPSKEFINLYTFVRHDCDGKVWVNESGGTNSQLTVVRFTPVDPPHHGWKFTLPTFDSDPEVTTVTADTAATAQVIYQIDLDDPNGSEPGVDPVDLQAGDVIIALGEVQVTYSESTPITFGSRLRLRNSDTVSPTTEFITRANDFTMKQGLREKKTAAEAGALVVPAPPANTHWKYVQLVAWAPDRQASDEVLVTEPGVQSGKLSVARLRLAQESEYPIAIQRYDILEYNEGTLGDPNHAAYPYAPMERDCTLMTANVHEVEFSQQLLNLNAAETLLATSEMEATNQDDDNPLKTLRSRLIVGTSSSTTDADANFTLNTATQRRCTGPPCITVSPRRSECTQSAI